MIISFITVKPCNLSSVSLAVIMPVSFQSASSTMMCFESLFSHWSNSLPFPAQRRNLRIILLLLKLGNVQTPRQPAPRCPTGGMDSTAVELFTP